MLRLDFTKELAARTGMYIKDAKKFERAFEELITEKLLEGDKVILSGFCTFGTKEYDAKNIYSPTMDEYYEVKARKRAKFTPSKTLLRKLKEQSLEDIPTEEI